jgi:hypothetical protein
MNAKICAKYHCDKHCVKMILELCQMLWTAFHVTGEENWENDVTPLVKIYKMAHKNHPTCIWVRSSPANFEWTVDLGMALCKEYTRRYDKTHACEKAFDFFEKNSPKCDETFVSPTAFYSMFSIPKGCTPPPLAMPQFFHYPDLIESYRLYYITDKSGFSVWKKGDKPDWF